MSGFSKDLADAEGAVADPPADDEGSGASVTAKQKAALRFRGFFAPRTALALKVRNLAVNALAVPFLANRLIGGSLRDELVLPDYLAAHR